MLSRDQNESRIALRGSLCVTNFLLLKWALQESHFGNFNFDKMVKKTKT